MRIEAMYPLDRDIETLTYPLCEDLSEDDEMVAHGRITTKQRKTCLCLSRW